MPKKRPAGALEISAYHLASKQPLPILVFLLPLVIAYEICLAVLLRSSEGFFTIKAHETLLTFFDVFGITATGGLYLGGAAIVVVMLVWHLLTRDPWRVDPAVPALMAVESLLLTVPLIILGLILPGFVSGEPVPAAAPAVELSGMSIWSKLAISVGAGLYEELLFRMLLIAVLHTLLVDVGKMDNVLGVTIAVIVSAVAFTFYHQLQGVASGIFFFLAGLYFGAVYALRGFGIVVGAHVFYDIIIVSVF